MPAEVDHRIRPEPAYARSDLFKRRHRLMDDWADYLAGRTRRRAAVRVVTRPAASPSAAGAPPG